MIPTFIFNQEQLQKAVEACGNHISALEISIFTDFEKLELEKIYIDLQKIYSDRLEALQMQENANPITTTYELVTNE